MIIDIITIFPDMFRGPFTESMIGRAMESGLVDIRIHNLRDYAEGRHKVTDDYPFGGGAGMVMKPEPIFAAVEDLVGQTAPWGPDGPGAGTRVILLCPQGRTFDQFAARELSGAERLVFICGHYEGVDERVRQALVTDEFSLGDFILTGGEPAAIAMVDAVVRLVPGVLGHELSAVEESYSDGLLEYPQYTRPKDFREWSVPDVLLSGHHENIRKWRREQSLRRTLARRPDLLAAATATAGLTEKERLYLAELESGGGRDRAETGHGNVGDGTGRGDAGDGHAAGDSGAQEKKGSKHG